MKNDFFMQIIKKLRGFVVIFLGTSFFAYTQTVLINPIAKTGCPFCGAPLSTHPMTLMIATTLGAGTATVVLTMKKITQKITDLIHKKFLHKQKT